MSTIYKRLVFNEIGENNNKVFYIIKKKTMKKILVVFQVPF